MNISPGNIFLFQLERGAKSPNFTNIMSFRAFILGLMASGVLAGVSYLLSYVLKQTHLIGNHFPIGIYGPLLLFLIFINPLAFRISRRLALSGGEIVVILTMALAMATIPGAGFLRVFGPLIVRPHHFDKTEPGWQENKLVDMIPDKMLADPSYDNESVVKGFNNSLRTSNESISFFDVPWEGLSQPLMFWIPVFLALFFAMIGLSLVVHKQWSEHEHMPYPLAKIVNSLLPGKGEGINPIFANRAFLICAGLVFLIHFNNFAFAQEWAPFKFDIEIKLNNLTDFMSKEFRAAAGMHFLKFNLYFMVIALGFFLARDVSFSMGIAPFLFSMVGGICGVYGYRMGNFDQPVPQSLTFGAYFGLFLSICYTGRFYYLSVIKRSVGMKSGEKVDSYAIWGARAFAVGMALFVVFMTSTGLDWQLVLIFAACLVILFLVTSRILVETGNFYLQPLVSPAIIILGIFGAQALGPETFVILSIASAILFVDPRELIMPFIVNSLGIARFQKLKLGRVSLFWVASILFAMLIAVPLTFYLQYDNGLKAADNWASNQATKTPFTSALQMSQRLEGQGMLESSKTVSGWERFSMISTDKPMLIAFCVGMALVLICSFLRLRFNKWPIHPVLFAVWAMFPTRHFAMCFLIGWMIKSIASKYGGENAISKMKPAMIGLIVGEALAAAVIVIVGLIMFSMGHEPKKFFIFPN